MEQLGPNRLKYCREKLIHNGVHIFSVWEKQRVTRQTIEDYKKQSQKREKTKLKVVK